ncbi:MAG TPA: hypothetical protein VKZ85_01915 [Woeseiaceae bacterium]|nr:hypothetical protein [Woeseiaceae bacterium]
MTRIALLVLLAGAASPALAEEVPDAFRRCAGLEDDAERLACYDRAVGREIAGRTAQAPEATDGVPESARAPAAAEPAAAVAGFGLPTERKEGIREISATVERITVRANGERIFTLDNGQVWVEDSPTRSVRVKEGDTVRIRAGLFNSFRLSVGESRRSTAVDRAR